MYVLLSLTISSIVLKECANQNSEEIDESEMEWVCIKWLIRERERDTEEEVLSFLLYLTISFPQTPLYWAASKGSVECVNELIKHGADVSTKDVRSERVCERISHRRRDVWEFVWFIDGCFFGCGGMATHADICEICVSHFSHSLSLSLFLSHSYLSSMNVSFSVKFSHFCERVCFFMGICGDLWEIWSISLKACVKWVVLVYVCVHLCFYVHESAKFTFLCRRLLSLYVLCCFVWFTLIM